eukprot:TRINITY_DN27020_c0_g1_i1.p1 TRINITY_DN27020_c0_g1~~TRINITY_DN27020_c0_g1_i1.p1  ORF type:complete len:552 (+),score=102.31 TRINITY_DN27020_c0_g1_i1:26-1657(+)
MTAVGSNGTKRPRPGDEGYANGGSAVASKPMQKGQQVLFFYEADASKQETALVKCGVKKEDGFNLVASHMWLQGTLEQAFDPAALDPARQETWPLVLPNSDCQFATRKQKPVLQAAMPQRVRHVRDATATPIRLSILFVRWGGEYSKWMDDSEPNDGDWGKYGSPPSDEYMGHLVNKGIMQHPSLFDADGKPLFELLHLFAKSSTEIYDIQSEASVIRTAMKGAKRCSFWMLWPVEWEDFEDPDYACYIGNDSLFPAIKACEAIGIRTSFPHPADQFQLIVSKSWMATLSLHPRARLPAATLVSKNALRVSPKAAAEQALRALHHIRAQNPFEVAADEPPCPSAVNKDSIVKGVVKLGYSWENRFVVTFNGVQQLEARLKELLGQKGCWASQAVVQEWVDFDFEMRLYFLPGDDWPEKYPIEPTMIQCNAWGPEDDSKGVGVSRASFSKVSEEQVLQRWEGDAAAWAAAKEKGKEVAQFLLAWLLSVNATPVPSIRLDFMVKRLGPGNARVIFGEFCEQGACCLGWVEGPPTIWRRNLDCALR